MREEIGVNLITQSQATYDLLVSRLILLYGGFLHNAKLKTQYQHGLPRHSG